MKIDKNIPIPNSVNKYPFQDMEIGDSFYVSSITTRKFSNYRDTKWTKYGKKFTAKKENDGVRIWRIS